MEGGVSELKGKPWVFVGSGVGGLGRKDVENSWSQSVREDRAGIGAAIGAAIAVPDAFGREGRKLESSFLRRI